MTSKCITKLVDAAAIERRYGDNLVADGAIEVHEVLKILLFVRIGVEKVDLVDNDNSRNTVGFGGGKETVDERGGRDRVEEGHHKHGTVNVSGEDMRLFREVAGSTDDIVLARENAGYESGAVVTFDNLDMIADSNRIGGTDAFESEVAFDFAIYFMPIRGEDHVPAAGVFDDEIIFLHKVEEIELMSTARKTHGVGQRFVVGPERLTPCVLFSLSKGVG